MRSSLRQVLFRSAGLDLNFAGGVFSLNNTRTASPAGIPGWSFSRTDTNGTATALDLAGNVIQFATGVPRITNRGILVEEARTNLFERSYEFDNAYWSKTNLTVTAGLTAPDGTATAQRIEATATAGTNCVRAVTVNATSATYSIFVKKGSGATDANLFALRNSTTATILVAGSFNYDTGVWTYTTGSTGVTVTTLANGWYRIAITATSGITSGNSIQGYVFFLGGSETAGENALAWGAQLELGSFATSPIITTGAAGTRGADSATLGSFVLPAAYTWVPEGYAPPIQTGQFPAMMGSTGSNTGLLLTGSTNTPGANMGNGTFNAGYGSAVAAGAMIKQGFRAETNNAIGGSNGTLGTVDTSFTPVVGSQTINIGTNHLGASPWNGYLTRIRILPTTSTDAQLQALTAP
jgi:hypothetical protein